MEHRRLGSTGLKVSAVSLGGWLTFGKSVDDEATRRILRAAVDHGVDYIDLADVYGEDGAAERAVGGALPELRRSALVLSSKVFWPTDTGANDRGLSRKHIMESCERSLSRLGTDYLDLYYCHREDPETPLEETARAMDDLVHQGKILYWGTSCWSARALLKAHALAGLRNLYAPVVEQPRYSLLARDVERRVMPVARRLGVGLVVWSPLAGGALTGKYDDGVPDGSRAATTAMLDETLSDANRPKLRRFSTIARELSVAPSQLALAWCLRRPEVASVITGATRPEQVIENVKAVEVRIPDDVLRELDQLFPRSIR
jgi:voltage-dependent potassium channel beta subunit